MSYFLSQITEMNQLFIHTTVEYTLTVQQMIWKYRRISIVCYDSSVLKKYPIHVWETCDIYMV